MATNAEIADRLRSAEELQSKFRYYFVALVFTLLAASIQTAEFDGGNAQAAAELIGWALFAISGITALSYLEWEPLIKEQLAQRDGFLHQVREAKASKLLGVQHIHVLMGGETQDIDRRISNLEASADLLKTAADRRLSIAGAKYEIWRWSFALALVSVLFSRGAPALANIFGYQLS